MSKCWGLDFTALFGLCVDTGIPQDPKKKKTVRISQSDMKLAGHWKATFIKIGAYGTQHFA